MSLLNLKQMKGIIIDVSCAACSGEVVCEQYRLFWSYDLCSLYTIKKNIINQN